MKIGLVLAAVVALAGSAFAQTVHKNDHHKKFVHKLGYRPARFVSRAEAKTSTKERHQRYIWKRDQLAKREFVARHHQTIHKIGSRPARFVSRTDAMKSAKLRHQRYIYRRDKVAKREAAARRHHKLNHG